MQRREFITLLGGATATMTAVLNAWAQPVGRMYRLGMLVQLPRNAAHWIAFFDELRKQGFLEGARYRDPAVDFTACRRGDRVGIA